MNTCCKQISYGYGFRTYMKSCGKPAKVERDGKHYCGIHNPAREEVRAAARNARWEASREADRAAVLSRREEAHKAACFDTLVTALETLLKRAELVMDQSPTKDGLGNCDALAQARRALSEATKP